MLKRVWNSWAFRHTVFYSHEIVIGLVWLAFTFQSGNTPMLSMIEAQYHPLLTILFHVCFATAGALFLIAVARPRLLLSAWVFSAFISVSVLIAALGVDGYFATVFYPVVWLLIIFISVTQSIKQFWALYDD